MENITINQLQEWNMNETSNDCNVGPNNTFEIW